MTSIQFFYSHKWQLKMSWYQRTDFLPKFWLMPLSSCWHCSFLSFPSTILQDLSMFMRWRPITLLVAWKIISEGWPSSVGRTLMSFSSGVAIDYATWALSDPVLHKNTQPLHVLTQQSKKMLPLVDCTGLWSRVRYYTRVRTRCSILLPNY